MSDQLKKSLGQILSREQMALISGGSGITTLPPITTTPATDGVGEEEEEEEEDTEQN